jgi:hypothetical protein
VSEKEREQRAEDEGDRDHVRVKIVRETDVFSCQGQTKLARHSQTSLTRAKN